MADSFFWADVLAYCHFAVWLLLHVVALLIFLSGIDDFLHDIAHHIRAAWRRFVVMPRYRPMTVRDLDAPTRQPAAILIPAWHEAAVIGPMLTHLTNSMDYDNYRIFVGVYPNDAETRAAVAACSAERPRIHMIVTPRLGPTSKGDCLNAVLDGIFRHERQTGEHFTMFVLHDAEDIVHPLELKLFNRLVPRKDMVQLPVLPLEAPLPALTAGHYMDEFAEHHSKDMPLREALTGAVPSAGVGCAFSRSAILALMAEDEGPVFNTHSMTEDYEIALRLKVMGKALIFVRFHVARLVEWRDAKGRERRRIRRELVGTREYFPRGIRAATKQKARWLTGIVFQGWSRFGWRGSLAMKYALFRDRKTIATTQITILAYGVGFAAMALQLVLWTGLLPYRYPPLVAVDTPLFYLLVANMLFLVNRVVHRAYYTGRIYGFRQAAVSPIRLVWGNAINFLASTRALWQVTRRLFTAEPFRWGKTDHQFPTQAELTPFHQRLGALLLERGLLGEAELTAALAEQQHSQQPLGQILTARGLISETDLLQTVSRQTGLPFRLAPERQALKPSQAMLPLAPDIAPLGKMDGHFLVASARLITPAEQAEIAAWTALPPHQILAPAAVVARARRAGVPELG